jgi:hypothetical protein
MHRSVLLLLAFPAFAFAQEPLSTQAAQKLAQGTFPEYLELLAMPNDAIVPADIQKNADWLEGAFRKRGFTTKQLDNMGKPMLYAEWPKKVAGAKTVLYYMHFDGQPVVPAEWSQPDPWKPVVKKSISGKWEIIPADALFADKLDSDVRVYARASSDDKGPILMRRRAHPAFTRWRLRTRRCLRPTPSSSTTARATRASAPPSSSATAAPRKSPSSSTARSSPCTAATSATTFPTLPSASRASSPR